MLRRRLGTTLDPLDVLRVLRDEPRLVALIGAWHHGEALIAFNPSHELDADPFDGIDLQTLDDGAGAFGGGWIGSWGFQLGANLERLPASPPRPLPQAEFTLGFYDYVLRRTNGAWWFEALVTEARSGLIDAEYDRMGSLLSSGAPGPTSYDVGTFEMTPSPEQHKAVLARTLDHIMAGDIFQANICVRLEAPFSGDPLDVFCQGVEVLRPAYAAFVRGPDGALASMSPELFLRRTGDEVLSSPIKGTAPLEADVDELVASAKNRAENIMIVDLMRNDLGRVSVPGSVRVPAMNRAERHAVWHLVSDVIGHVRSDIRDSDLLRATFPPGSVTGAPKVRAMEIINTLETTGREAYTGAIGHVSPCAGMELNVVIRTFEFCGPRVWLGVGGGIVADSTTEGEYAECLVKARPLIDAIGGRLDLTATVTDEPEGRIQSVEKRVGDINTSWGVFETLLVLDGRAIDVEMHLARLDASIRAVYGTTILAGLESAVEHRAQRLDGRHRMRITAVPRPDGTTDIQIDTGPLSGDAEAWTLTPRTIDEGLGAHKWCDRRLLSPAGARGARGHDRDLLLCADDGAILETARASIFVVRDEGVYTPALDGRNLPGTARARVIEILLEAGVPVFQRRVTVDDLAAATEVFVTNALRGVVPVIGCEGVGGWPLGKTTAWLKDKLWELWLGHPAGRDSEATTSGPGVAKSPPEGVRGSKPAKVLLIDNYDSFVYNLAQYFGELGASTTVVRNDAVTVDELMESYERGELTHLAVSPGPGTPSDAGISSEAIRRLGPLVPTLGVCLGHQCIGEVFGATVVRAREVVHGKPSLIHHDGKGVYAGIGSPLVAARYHSLVVDPPSMPETLTATAHTAGGVIMGVRHTAYPIEGVQMHPESILTAHGHELLDNFLRNID
ncbi:MAG: chorismate-binding protein [Aeromicrobium sp.]